MGGSSSKDIPKVEKRAVRGSVSAAEKKYALVIIDMQNDFLPGGSLAVGDSDKLIPLINSMKKDHAWDMVVMSKDWHPLKHMSFCSTHKAQGAELFKPFNVAKPGEPEHMQMMWPDHCVQGTKGSELHIDLDYDPAVDRIVLKGQNIDIDSYSAFYDNDHKTSTGLTASLKEKRITDVVLCGVAYDYCVGYSAIDAFRDGFTTHFVEDASKGVTPDSTAAMREKLVESNVKLINASAIPVPKREKKEEKLYRKSAFVVIDVQNDFLPGGSLAVPNGDEVVGVVNGIYGLSWDMIVLSKDWHPKNHISFCDNHTAEEGAELFQPLTLPDGTKQVMWPVHCVQGTQGSDFPPELNYKGDKEFIVFKGQNPLVDSYSAFYDNNRKESTGLTDVLRRAGITDVYLSGLAYEYCVGFSALDAVQDGFNTFFVEDAARGLGADEIKAMRSDMLEKGVKIVEAKAVEGLIRENSKLLAEPKEQVAAGPPGITRVASHGFSKDSILSKKPQAAK